MTIRKVSIPINPGNLSTCNTKKCHIAKHVQWAKHKHHYPKLHTIFARTLQLHWRTMSVKGRQQMSRRYYYCDLVFLCRRKLLTTRLAKMAGAFTARICRRNPPRFDFASCPVDSHYVRIYYATTINVYIHFGIYVCVYVRFRSPPFFHFPSLPTRDTFHFQTKSIYLFCVHLRLLRQNKDRLTLTRDYFIYFKLINFYCMHIKHLFISLN